MSSTPAAAPEIVDLAIAGGGIIGLSIAWFARQRGLSVCVVDAPRPAASATPASAGVIWPLEPLADDSPFWPWVRAGVEMYPAWIAELVGDRPELVEFARHGLLRLGADPNTLLPGEHWREAEGPCPAGAYVPQVDRVSPRRLQEQLRQACQARGVHFVVDSVEREPPASAAGCRVWQTHAGSIHSHRQIWAQGAWPAADRRWPQPLRPVRGQMLALMLDRPWHGPIVQGTHMYMVPRTPAAVILGATVEEAGFDAQPTVAGRQQILAQAADVLALLGPYRVMTQWAGLRPRYGQGTEPCIGALDDRTAGALGLYRLGVTAAPAVGQALAAWAAEERKLPLIGSA